MARIPYAMQTLIQQVFDHKEDAEVNVEEEDGLGVYRQVTFDEQTSKWLHPIISLIAREDGRIQSFHLSRGGMLLVNFGTGPEVETRDLFLIPQVDAVLNPPEPAMKFRIEGTAEGHAPAVVPDEPASKPAKKETSKATKKAPAKKTAKKAAKPLRDAPGADARDPD